MEIGRSRVGFDSRMIKGDMKPHDGAIAVGESRIGVGPDDKKPDRLMTVGVTRIEDGNRMGDKRDETWNKNENASEEGFFAQTMLEMAKQGKDFSSVLDVIKDFPKLAGVYREVSKALDPSLDDKNWDAIDGLVQAVQARIDSMKKNTSPEASAPVGAPEVAVSSVSVENLPKEVVSEAINEDEDTVTFESPDDTLEQPAAALAQESVDDSEPDAENREPSREEKVSQMESILKHKEAVVNSIMKGFVFDQGNGDWIQACSELLSDTQVIDAQLANDMREVADSMRNIKKLYGEKRTDAIERVQRVERAVRQKVTEANTQRGGKLSIDVSKQFLTDKDAFADFKGLVLGGDMGSRNKNTEGYWKSMKKFLANDSSLGAAEAVVDQILQQKIYNNADERGVNKALGAKALDLLAAVPKKARTSAAAA